MDDDSPKRVKASSVAAFLFMPQFRLSFQHFSFIMPVFIRTIALMFTQAGLLPQNHPATQYGAEGVRKYGFSELMGESWHTLRASPSVTPYQWGLFISVALMFVFMIVSAVAFILHLSGTLVGTAAAQIFDSPNSGGAYGPQGEGLYNNTIGTGTHADYGIMIIDKLFREGIAGVGGPMQNALGGLMEIYNTGVLVIAGIMLFWIIISVVVDTARTGQIGGGRHNMVWAPIRIVFALGLLIPLGSSGFSSGQFAVMKLAEWGSNFGTRGWNTYIEAAFLPAKAFTEPTDKNMMNLIANYEKMWICRIAYNGATQKAMGAIPPAQEIVHKYETGVFDYGVKTFDFSNDSARGICGAVRYGKATPPSKWTAFFTGGLSLIYTTLTTYATDNATAYAALFAENGTPGSGGLESTAKKFACGFVAQWLFPGAGGNPPDPLSTVCAGTGYATGVCGAGPADGSGPNGRPDEPDMSCIYTMVSIAHSKISGALKTAFNGAKSKLDQGISQDLKTSGWPAMGLVWYKLAAVNRALLSSAKPPLTIQPGNGAGGDSKHAEKVKEILGRYNVWWQETPPKSETIAEEGLQGYTSGTNYKADTKKATDEEGDVNNDYSNVVGAIVKDGIAVDSGPNLFDMKESDLYPLTQLVVIGNAIVVGSSVFIAAVAAVQAVLGILDASGLGFSLGNFGASIAGGMLFQALFAMGVSLLGAGLVLSFWVPMIPFVRVAFSVLTWMVSIFEAVMMVPIAALAHLTTEGEGIAGGAKQVWILWLNVLLRPMLTVVGFVGSLLVFNTFVIYFNSAFGKISVLDSGNTPGIFMLLAMVANAVIYVGVVYTAANMSFKLLDIIPSALMKWIGGGQADTSFDEGAHAVSGMISQGSQAVSSGAGQGAGAARDSAIKRNEPPTKPGTSKAP
jgi:conjugal transfer/type IV secretion protein DotA/TraY